MPIEDAVDQTIQECIEEGILREFLEKNRAEARKMSIYEYNEEEHMRMEREEFFEEGLKEGQKRERQNTEKERRRAEAAEKEIARLKAELEKMKKV